MGPVELCGSVDCGFVQHQYLDDSVVHDSRRSVVVAGVAIYLDRLLLLRRLREHDGPHWCRVPHWLPRRQQSVLWYLGKLVADIQPSCYGFVCVLPLEFWEILSDWTCPLTRSRIACVWYGVQSYIGGHCVYLMISSIWKRWVRGDPFSVSPLRISYAC